MDYQNELNSKQYEAVTTSNQYVRVVAGAGSGKTRVLTYRIAYLMDQLGVYQNNILAFTFTNKVAQEMQNRVIKLIGEDLPYLKIKTFHSFSAYFLRLEINNLGFPSSFTILDEDDSNRIIKDICASLGYSKKDEMIKFAYNFINKYKLKEQYPDDIDQTKLYNQNDKECLKIYRLYEEQKNKMYALDFDDLLLYTLYILKSFPKIREKWQNKFLHILVDEFQDTNDTEFKLISLLMKEDTSLYVVGDPDQTIYTWRGANQNIILDLEKRYPNIETIILNENYRSTQKILNSANNLIEHNRFRIKKELYTKSLSGDAVICKGFLSNVYEAQYVVKEILRLRNSKRYSYKDFVLLYRSNYVSLDFEKELISNHIPYRIFGGLKFYQRKEIKDVIAYLRVIVNPKDDSAFERIINAPKRGIGEISIAKLKNEAEEANLSLYEYVNAVNFENSKLSSKVINLLKTMVTRLNILKDDLEKNEEAYATLIDNAIRDFNYYSELEKLDDGEDRIENIRALFQDMRQFLRRNPDSKFSDYLQESALLSSQDEIVDGDNVTLMTVHTAKGLEYPVVFVVRFNDSIFPHIRSVSEGGYQAMEEERRLAYVAFTRAKERLYVTFSNGYSFTTRSDLIPSRFINEAKITISNEPIKRIMTFNEQDNIYYVDDYSYQRKQKNNNLNKSEVVKEQIIETNNIIWHVGDRLQHKTFGYGTVKNVEPDGIICIDFDDHGEKFIVGNHRFLSKVEPS